LNSIAIITARGGSKRIPRKNIRSFLGNPILSYVIKAAIGSGLFEEVMVSTDDDEIASVATQFGAVVPFMRSREKSDDFATTADVLEEVLNKYSEINKVFDFGCCLYPTAAFVTPQKIKEAWELMDRRKFDVVVPIVKYGNPVLRSFRLQEGKMVMNFPEYLNYRSQDLPATYYDSGQFYWFRVESFIKEKNLYTANTGGFEIDEMECQDIDTEQDWKMAELKYRMLHEIDQPSSVR
jgi:pseudaminic acid cytidylyltransferase